MREALKLMTDEERAAEEAWVRRIMHEVHHIEPEEKPSRCNPVSIVVLAYAASLCVVVAWLAVGGVL